MVLIKGSSRPSKYIVFVCGSPLILIPPVPTNNTLLFTCAVTGSNATIELPPLISNCPKAFAYKRAVLSAVGSFIRPAFGPSNREKVAFAALFAVYVSKVVLIVWNPAPYCREEIDENVIHIVPPAPSVVRTRYAGIFELLLPVLVKRLFTVNESIYSDLLNDAILSCSKILSLGILVASED